MPADRSVGDFGGKLRDARERRGVSLRQIANATKISVAALEALERNDASRLPGGIFSRAFVRSYAVEVGLDPEATIQEFIAQFPSESATAGHSTADQVEDHEAVESERRTAGTFLWLAVVSLPIAGALLYFATGGRAVFSDAAPSAPAAPAQAAQPQQVAPPVSDTAAAASTPATPAAGQPAPSAPPAAVDPSAVA